MHWSGYIPSPFLFKVNSNQKSFRNPLDKLAARPIALNPPYRDPLHIGARWARVGGALSRVILDHPTLVLLIILSVIVVPDAEIHIPYLPLGALLRALQLDLELLARQVDRAQGLADHPARSR